MEINKTDNDTNPFRYCGEYYDSETDSIYLRARYYKPTVGRFITEDPINDKLNWYSYCENNPIALIDPSGEGAINNNLSKEWEGCKNALTWVWNEANATQKKIQRKFWRKGAELILSKGKGYSTSAWLLEHSLQDNPSNVERGEYSRIANLINTDNAYLRALDNAIANSKDNKLENYKISVAFENGDLYYSIHKSDIYLTGYKREDGKWIVHAILEDDYDFTEIQSFMTDSGDWSWDVGLGTVANDVAVVSQQTGAIQPYHITVSFWTTR